jgi:disulfide bond formation protein DsbB
MSVPRSNLEIATVKWFRRPFMSLAVICLFIGLMPYWQHVTLKGLPDGKTETRNVFTLGIPPSPLLHLEQVHSEQVRGTGITTSDSRGFKLEFVSWSMLSLVLGASFFVADRLRGGNRQSSPGD